MHCLKVLYFAALALVVYGAVVPLPSKSLTPAPVQLVEATAALHSTVDVTFLGAVNEAQQHRKDNMSLASEEDTMLALDRAVFQGSKPASDEEVFSEWGLSSCIVGCDMTHLADRTKLRGHPTFSDMPFEDVTFAICTTAFHDCNHACQKAHRVHLATKWPPLNADWPILTSTQLNVCINRCNSEAANDDRKLTNKDSHQPDMTYGTFAYCNEGLGNCTRNCEEEFNKKALEFREDNLS